MVRQVHKLVLDALLNCQIVSRTPLQKMQLETLLGATCTGKHCLDRQDSTTLFHAFARMRVYLKVGTRVRYTCEAINRSVQP